MTSYVYVHSEHESRRYVISSGVALVEGSFTAMSSWQPHSQDVRTAVKSINSLNAAPQVTPPHMFCSMRGPSSLCSTASSATSRRLWSGVLSAMQVSRRLRTSTGGSSTAGHSVLGPRLHFATV